MLGSELAATVRGLGHRVTLIGPQQALMQRQLGSDVGTALTELHAGRGVDLRLDRAVEKLIDDGGRLSDRRFVGHALMDGRPVGVIGMEHAEADPPRSSQGAGKCRIAP
ncbi:MAG TPA: FAD-dependent oxidoreductase [Microlunatus sp.]